MLALKLGAMRPQTKERQHPPALGEAGSYFPYVLWTGHGTARTLIWLSHAGFGLLAPRTARE